MDAEMQRLVWKKNAHELKNIKMQGTVLWGTFTEAQPNSGSESIYTYSTVPGLGKQRRKRENTVNE